MKCDPDLRSDSLKNYVAGNLEQDNSEIQEAWQTRVSSTSPNRLPARLTLARVELVLVDADVLHESTGYGVRNVATL